MRIRIQQIKLIRIHADPEPDPKPCKKGTGSRICNTGYKQRHFPTFEEAGTVCERRGVGGLNDVPLDAADPAAHGRQVHSPATQQDARLVVSNIMPNEVMTTR